MTLATTFTGVVRISREAAANPGTWQLAASEWRSPHRRRARSCARAVNPLRRAPSRSPRPDSSDCRTHIAPCNRVDEPRLNPRSMSEGCISDCSCRRVLSCLVSIHVGDQTSFSLSAGRIWPAQGFVPSRFSIRRSCCVGFKRGSSTRLQGAMCVASQGIRSRTT